MKGIAKQRQKLEQSITAAKERFDYWLSELSSDSDDAVELEYFAHGMEGVVDLVQEVANDAGYLADLIDPKVEAKV